MKSRIFIILVIMVHVLSVNCRHLTPTSAVFTAIPPQELTMGLEQGGSVVEKRIGSSPPSCKHKCYGCSPCEATQVPTNGGQVNVSIEYSNYEPEGWKCKCGRTFYSP
ncbi:putative EPIDERMAL PATTERNING FACTOR-like protein [Helianthus annuus]|nr:putative EPIDERMAL PATTERNING FACTOR-like protein [Helianthus annuus]